jgi:hypothetical protein
VSGTDELGMMVIDLDLSAQASDGKVHRARADVGIEISPDGPEQFAPAHDDVTVLGQIA